MVDCLALALMLTPIPVDNPDTACQPTGKSAKVEQSLRPLLDHPEKLATLSPADRGTQSFVTTRQQPIA
jgi:hypothetical protein